MRHLRTKKKMRGTCSLQNIPSNRIEKAIEELSSIEMEKSEAIKLLKKLQPDKSPGQDEINPRVSKKCAEELAGPLTLYFTSSHWRRANHRNR